MNDTLKNAYAAGMHAVFARYGVKHANVADTLKGVGTSVMHMFTGDPALRQKFFSGKAFGPGQPLHWENVFWPRNQGTIGNWIGRLGTVVPAYNALKSLAGEGDPNQGRLEGALGSLGQAAGFAYGNPLVGMIGAPFAASLGEQLGRSVGRALGSHPKPHAMPHPYYDEAYLR